MGVEIGAGLLTGTAVFAGMAVLASFILAVYVKARTRDPKEKKSNCV